MSPASHSDCSCLVLAAGKGTRMKSALPKVLMPLLGEPMLDYVLSALAETFGQNVLVVVGHRADLVQAAFPAYAGRFVTQAEQLGTGHAFMVAVDALRSLGRARVLVVNGDTPLLPRGVVERFLAASEGAQVSFLTAQLPDPAGFGRVVRRGGQVCIVEAKDYDEALHGPVSGEINAGAYVLDLDAVVPLHEKLSCANASGEYYITDLPRLAQEAGYTVRAVASDCGAQLLGINSPAELVAAEEELRAALVAKALGAGCLVRFPHSVRLGPRTTLEPGCRVDGPCEIAGQSHVCAGAVVESFCMIKDSRLGPDAHVLPFSHLEGAVLEARAVAGPYARLRPGALMRQGSRVGNFVEMKKAELGPGAKANHLTYLGDAEIGAGANIGAGTITCNYDGKLKHKTVIGEKAFIGSNTALVAPVTVGEGALVGAGSVITKDVEPGALAVARGKQVNMKRR